MACPLANVEFSSRDGDGRNPPIRRTAWFSQAVDSIPGVFRKTSCRLVHCDANKRCSAFGRLGRQSCPLLLCDFGNLEKEVLRLEEAGVQAFHLDVMDGNFVPT